MGYWAIAYETGLVKRYDCFHPNFFPIFVLLLFYNKIGKNNCESL